MKILVYCVKAQNGIYNPATNAVENIECLTTVKRPYSTANEEIAKAEAYNGKPTIEDDGQPELTPEPTIWDELAAAYSEGVNEA